MDSLLQIVVLIFVILNLVFVLAVFGDRRSEEHPFVLETPLGIMIWLYGIDRGENRARICLAMAVPTAIILYLGNCQGIRAAGWVMGLVSLWLVAFISMLGILEFSVAVLVGVVLVLGWPITGYLLLAVLSWLTVRRFSGVLARALRDVLAPAILGLCTVTAMLSATNAILLVAPMPYDRLSDAALLGCECLRWLKANVLDPVENIHPLILGIILLLGVCVASWSGNFGIALGTIRWRARVHKLSIALLAVSCFTLFADAAIDMDVARNNGLLVDAINVERRRKVDADARYLAARWVEASFRRPFPRQRGVISRALQALYLSVPRRPKRDASEGSVELVGREAGRYAADELSRKSSADDGGPRRPGARIDGADRGPSWSDMAQSEKRADVASLAAKEVFLQAIDSKVPGSESLAKAFVEGLIDQLAEKAYDPVSEIPGEYGRELYEWPVEGSPDGHDLRSLFGGIEEVWEIPVFGGSAEELHEFVSTVVRDSRMPDPRRRGELDHFKAPDSRFEP